MWLLVDEFNSQYWWNYPHFFDIGAVIVRTGSSSSNYFGIFQLGWALTLLFLFSTLNGVTCMWLLVDEFNSQYWWNYPHFFETLEPLLYVQALPAPTIFGIFQLGWAPLFLSARSMGCNVHVTTHGWIQLAVLVELSTSLTHWSRYCTYRLFQLQLFWYLSTRMGPNPFVSFQHAQWVVTCDYSWMNSTRSIGGTIPFLWHIGAVIVRTGSSSSTILVSFN
jgi:hypothetical protein